MALNRIEGLNLYIGGVISLRNKTALRNANITHVVSVLRMRPEEDLTQDFEQLKIDVDDVDDEDLIQYFASANAFIQAGLDAGGGVLVHCAMGKSRSATICIAYLMHRNPQRFDPESTLEVIRRTRAIAEPNDGFMKQLWLYHEMKCPDDVTGHPNYLRWQSLRQIELSAACGKAPEIEAVRFEDELQSQSGLGGSNGEEKQTEIRCRKCRRILATTAFINPHDRDANSKKSPSRTSTDEALACAHIFLHPLTWMRPCLFPGASAQKDLLVDDPSISAGASPAGETEEDAPLSGRLICPNPKCEANVGKFAWQGLRCSCGKWVVPAIGVARARVDVTESKGYSNSEAATAIANKDGNTQGGINNNSISSRLGAMGIRLPPHMRPSAQERGEQNPKNSL